MKTTLKFIDSLVTGKDDSKDSAIANYIQSQQSDNILNRIAQAYVQLKRERNEAVLRFKSSGNPADKVVEVKPEQMLGYVQQLMNNACWAVRRARIAIIRQEEDAAVTGMATNADFTGDSIEEQGLGTSTINAKHNDIDHSLSENGVDFYGFESHDTLVDALDDVFKSLGNVHHFLRQQMSYLDSDSFAYFLQKEPQDDGSWTVTAEALCWTDAQFYMERIVEELPEKQTAKEAEQANEMDFETGNVRVRKEHTATEKPVRTASAIETELEADEYEELDSDSDEADSEYMGHQDCSDLLSPPNIDADLDRI